MKKPRLLVVEDDVHDLEMLMRVLDASGRFRVDVVYNARSAQEALKDKKYRAMLTNLKLPDMDGYAFLRYTKDRYAEMPICVVTGYEEEYHRSRIRDAGAIIVFAKPYSSVDNQALLNLLDLTEAVYTSGKGPRSWRTTACAAIAMIGCTAAMCLSQSEPDKLARDIATMAVALGLVYARDQKAKAPEDSA